MGLREDSGGCLQLSYAFACITAVVVSASCPSTVCLVSLLTYAVRVFVPDTPLAASISCTFGVIALLSCAVLVFFTSSMFARPCFVPELRHLQGCKSGMPYYLRGAIVNRAHGDTKIPYSSLLFLTIFGPV